MTKRSKLMIGVSAMLLATAGVAATGTFAWYTATAAADVTSVAADASVGTAASTLSAVTYHVEVSYTGAALTTVKLSDKNGNTWAVVGGYIRAATGSPLYGATSTTVGDYTVKIYADSDGSRGAELTGADLATAKANLKATGTDYNLNATGSGSVRLTLTNPSSNFATAFGDNINNTIKVGELSFDSGEPVLSGMVAGYYSVSGNAENTVPTAGTAASEWIPSTPKITFGLTVKS